MSIEAVSEALGVEVGPMDKVSITVASPDVIRSWSKGEVKNPETINYNDLDDLPSKYRIKGKILRDVTEDKIYFQFVKPVDKSIAKIKVSAMNAEVKRRTGKKISKWAYAQGPDDETLILFRNLE